MKTKIFPSSVLALVVLFVAISIGVSEASAATGTLKNIFPPGNKGAVRGVGMIDGHDGNKYIIQTPVDNGGQELNEGDEVSFELGNGRTVRSITQESSGLIGQARLTDSNGDGYGDSYIKMPPRDIDKLFLVSVKDGDNVTARKRLGRLKCGDVTLERCFQRQEGKKGLNAVDVRTSTIKQEGDPIGDIDITIDLLRKKGVVKFFNENKSVSGPTKVIRVIKEIKL